MRNKVSKILISGLLVFCMVIAVFWPTEEIKAADLPVCEEHTTFNTKTFTADEVANYRKTKPYQIPEIEEGYLFAGWYTDSKCTSASAVRDGDEIVSGNTYYAKCIPEHVADVKAQLSLNLTTEGEDQSTGKIRFVTTVDSLAYQQSGFYISYNGKTIKNSSDTVYTEIVATDIEGSQIINPKVFCGISKYFRACTIANVKNKSYAVQFDVQAFWMTLDGTEVCGPEVSKQMEDGVIKDVAYVSSTGSDDNGTGTQDSPYKTLGKALENVDTYGKVVILDSCAVSTKEVVYEIPAAKEEDYAQKTEHVAEITDNDDTKDKKVTITGGTLDFEKATEIKLCDSVKFENIALTFEESTSLFANGYTLEVSQTTTLPDHSNGNDHSKNLTVYGGSRDSEITGDTNLILYAGTYANIYGGGYVSGTSKKVSNAYVNGNTNIVIGGTVNAGKTYEKSGNHKHDIDYGLNLFGGGREAKTAIRGNTNITVESSNNSFQYIYGGSRNTHVTGVSTVNFYNGTAMSLFGGGYGGEAQGDTYVTMTDGTVEQVFGGAQSMNVSKANTNVQILGGTVTRRVYGGSYNNYPWGNTLYSVSGNSNVMISPKATLSFEKGTVDIEDYALCAVSRHDDFFENEWGVFILNENDTSTNSKISGFSSVGSSSKSHHYMVTTNGNAKVNSLGTVSPQSKYIHIEPKTGYAATVYQVTDSVRTELHYTESESIYELPALANKSENMDIYVEFAAKTNKTTYEAKVGQAYYPSLELAMDIAHEMYANREKKVADDTVVVTLLSDAEVESTLNVQNDTNITLKNEIASVTIYRGSELSNANLITVADGATLQVEGLGKTVNGDIITRGLTIDGRTKNEASAETATNASTGSRYELMKNSGTLTLKNTIFQNVNHNSSSALESGRQEHGGVLYATNESDTTITNCVFSNNQTGELGTVLFVNSDSQVTITDSEFRGNAAPNRSAGVIYAYEATVTATNCDFTNNTAKYNGGAVNSTNTTLTMTDCTFDKNTIAGTDAMRPAGAVYIAQTGTATINNCTFTSNTAYYYGGALYAVGNSTDVCEVEIKNSTFENNAVSNTFHESTDKDGNPTTDSSGSRGGAVFLTKVNATVSDTSFSGNTARRGGGVCVDQSITEFNNCTFEGNAPTTAQAYGAAMYINGINTTTINGSTFKNNTGKNNGGAISIYGKSKTDTIVNVNDTDFSENKTPSAWGGAMYVQKATATVCNTNFVSNESNNGGAIGVEQNGIVNVSADKEGRGLFSQNYAKKQGGAIRSYLSGAAKNTFVIGITGCTFDLNHADENGGAIGADQGTDLNINSCDFKDNYSSGGNGGAIASTGVSAINRNSAITVENNTTFTNNKANGTQKSGGAVYLSCADGAFNNTTFLANVSTYGGGAIFNNQGTVTLTGGTFENNSTTTKSTDNSGGAICSKGDSKTLNATVTITGTTFEGNTSTQRGGAIQTMYGTLDVTNADFDGNKATGGNGGAICASNNSTVKVYSNDNSSFDNNETSAMGGALYNGGTGTMTVEGYTFTGNKTTSTDETYKGGNAIYFNITILEGFYVKNCNFASDQKINKTDWNTDNGNSFDWTATE